MVEEYNLHEQFNKIHVDECLVIQKKPFNHFISEIIVNDCTGVEEEHT